MERHRREQHDEPHRIGRFVRRRVNADERTDEQVARPEEVHDHPLVPNVVDCRPAEDARVVEHKQRAGEDSGRDDRIGEDAEEARVHNQQNPLPRPTTAIAPLVNRPQSERDRCRGHEQNGDHHTERHVREHVLTEQELLVDVDAAVRHVEQQRDTRHPQRAAIPRPGVATTAQAPHRREVEERGEHAHEYPQDVEVPRREQSLEGNRGRQGSTGKQLGRRRVGQIGCRHQPQRSRGSRQRGRHPRCHTHERELGHHEPPEPAAAFAVRCEPRNEKPPIRDTEEPECAQRADLHEYEDAVRRQQVLERPDADLRTHVAARHDRDEAHQRDRRVPRHEVTEPPRLYPKADERQSQNAAQPQSGADDMNPDRADRRVMAGEIPGVTLQRHRHESEAGGERHREHEALVAHGEAQHRQRRGRERRRQPGLSRFGVL